MAILDDFRLTLGGSRFVPIMIGGMGVDISTADLAVEASRLGGIGHISDAMSTFLSDKRFLTRFTQAKARLHRATRDQLDKSRVKFNLEDLWKAQLRLVRDTMSRKIGEGGIFINVMEKLAMAAPRETLRARLRAAMEGGIDGITLSAGLHTHSLNLIEDHARFRDVMIGIIVSSQRALKIFLRSAARLRRLPDYIVVEGPLAGGHLGFGDDWREHKLSQIAGQILQFLKDESLEIPVIPAGGIFTGSDAVEALEAGASAVQVATRFTVTRECGLPDRAKQAYFGATEDQVFVSKLSPTGYPIRLLRTSPCIDSGIKPQCEPFGYMLDREGRCQYLDAYRKADADERGRRPVVKDKACLCYHFSKHNCYTCGQYVYRLKDTTRQRPDGSYQLLTAEQVFDDYRYSKDHRIALPAPDATPVDSRPD